MTLSTCQLFSHCNQAFPTIGFNRKAMVQPERLSLCVEVMTVPFQISFYALILLHAHDINVVKLSHWTYIFDAKCWYLRFLNELIHHGVTRLISIYVSSLNVFCRKVGSYFLIYGLRTSIKLCTNFAQCNLQHILETISNHVCFKLTSSRSRNITSHRHQWMCLF